MEKVFEFNNEGEKDWVAADTIKQAKEFYADFSGQPESDLDEIWEVKELTDYEAERNIVIDYNDHYSDENGDHKNDGEEYIDGHLVLGSMKALAQSNLSPELIASNYE